MHRMRQPGRAAVSARSRARAAERCPEPASKKTTSTFWRSHRVVMLVLSATPWPLAVWCSTPDASFRAGVGSSSDGLSCGVGPSLPLPVRTGGGSHPFVLADHRGDALGDLLR